MKRLAIIVSAVIAFGGLAAPPATAQTTDAVTVARNFIAAENAHNTTATIAAFAPGAIVNLPTGPLATPADIAAWQRELAAGNFAAVINTPVAVTPEVVTFTGTVALDLFRGLGIASLDSTWQLTIQLGKITTFNFDFTPAASARLAAALGAPAAPAASGTTATTVRATPATATSGSLALTGADVATPAEAAGVALLIGLVLMGVARRRASAAGGS